MRDLDISTESTHLGGLAPRLMIAGMVVAGAAIAGAFGLANATEGGFEHLQQTYVVSFAFFLSVSLGALFFVLLHHLTRAGWSVVVRRLAEGLACNLQLMVVLAIPIVLWLHQLYHWSHAEEVAHDPLLSGKAGFLNPTFFMIRLAIYFAVWIGLARFFFATSTRQDSSGDPAATRRMERVSAPGMVLFALSVNFAAFDLLMSLDPHWFSTIYGVYFFAGGVVSFFAFLPLVVVGLQASGRLTHAVGVEHFHDIGKFLFAFVVFWAYIAFSQYMLIWYANLPEETQWFLKRQTGDWGWVSLALLFGNFVIPFLALISRFPKRRPGLLAVAAVWLLVMHWLDLYWLVIPEFSAGVARFGLLDVLCFVGLAGLYVATLALWLRKHSLLPTRDPRLHESLAFDHA